MSPALITRVYVGVGSNMGDKLSNCRKAVRLVGGMEDTSLVERSPFYRTEPLGLTDQDWYLNGVIGIQTYLSPQDLLRSLLSIETHMGRVRNERWGPRIIDLDILLYGNRVIDETNLTIPHPLMHRRRFVLIPMVQLDPDLIHPVLGRTMKELSDDLSGEGQAVAPVDGE
ncbi:MAG: 2-amino-4-hydroxy-6-hydroxymethyldihydropteridine diphosphokinase [Deltaproteobacteria bacterium]|nr:2-amino-4-hydroxy-6-hydroxymethyldihydropteridine diphosphokinase [Deltaproteobacteria bacterium]MBW2110900.1 2-amino-4-hydroxy-6-hydroxymethyldihydropteridine diphosphokinase [Deltaproteobacteria bacterium]